MPTPKTYNYTTNDVVMVPGVKRVFFDFRDESGLFVPSFRENNVCYRSFARNRFTRISRESPGIHAGDETSLTSGLTCEILNICSRKPSDQM